MTKPTFDIPDYPSRSIAQASGYRFVPWDDWIGMQHRAVAWKEYAESIEARIKELETQIRDRSEFGLTK